MTAEINHDERAHAECSPSQLKRIIGCPGSRRLKKAYHKKYGEEPSSTFAAEGTMLHEVAEAKIRIMFPKLFPGEVIAFDFPELTKEQHTVTDECVDYFASVLREVMILGPCEVTLEAQTSLIWCGLDEVGGHVDVKIYCPTAHRLDIIDWKFGQGEAVSSEENYQLSGYAGGAVGDLEELLQIEELNLHVVQPRLNYFEPWATTGFDLAQWIEHILMPGIYASRDPKAVCIPGEEQCRWCIKTKCRAYVDLVQETASTIFKDFAQPGINPADADFIDERDLADLLGKAKMVDKFIKELSGHALNLCLSGEGFPGYKAVVGRSSRKWRDEKVAEAWLIDKSDTPGSGIDFEDIYETKMTTPPKVEKLTKSMKKNKDFQALYVKLDGKPTLAIAGDKRPEYNVQEAASSAFANIDADDTYYGVKVKVPKTPAADFDIFS